MPKSKTQCDGSGRKVPNMHLKLNERTPCTVCGKETRVVNYRPKIGGLFADHVDERT
jgi:hypothetical protein